MYHNQPLCKIAAPNRFIVFKKLNALWHLFLNSICHRLATPKKAKPFAINYNSRIRGKSCKIFFQSILVNLPQEYKIFPGSNPRSKISIHLFNTELQLNIFRVCISFFLDRKRNKKIKAAQNFGNNIRLNRYILESIVTH